MEGQNLPLLQRLAFGVRMGLGQGILRVIMTQRHVGTAYVNT